ncbi:MAG: Amuc_1100 family pilus-like protein [Verrucomicrobiota bacterium]|nr:Amuc_1100 family pilus-like protein [Verrucomicrobiota bacterium]
MDKQLVIFYAKRHLFGIVGILLAIGFIVGGVVVSGKSSASLNVADQTWEEVKGRRDKIQNSPVKVDMKNVSVINADADSYEQFINNSGQVLEHAAEIQRLSNIEFGNYLVRAVALLNKKAKDSYVKLPASTNKVYGFTFGLLMGRAELAEDKIPELQVQLQDVETISEVLFQSRVQSITQIQRNRVTLEDMLAKMDPRYLEARQKYTNSVAVVRPYKVRFRCLSDGVALALSGFASQKTFFVVRNVEIAPPGADVSSGGGQGSMSYGGGSGGSGGEEGGGEEGGGSGGAGPGSGSGGSGGSGGQSEMATNAIQLLVSNVTRALVRYRLTAPPARNILSESLLEVNMDIDVIRRVPGPQEGSGEAAPKE